MSLEPLEFFRALADETRLRCLALLVAEGELCVCELTHALDMVQPKISRHLAVLRGAHVVSDRRAGLWIYYRVHPDLPEWARRVLDAAIDGVKNRQPFASDRLALSEMPSRPGGRCCA